MAGGVALAGCIGWIEKRFREVRKDALAADTELQRKLISDLNLSTAEHRNASARLERRGAELTNLITEVRLQHARDYPTKDDLQMMTAEFGRRIDKMETRMEAGFNKQRRGP